MNENIRKEGAFGHPIQLLHPTIDIELDVNRDSVQNKTSYFGFKVTHSDAKLSQVERNSIASSIREELQVKQSDYDDEIRAMDKQSSNRPSPIVTQTKAVLAKQDSLVFDMEKPDLSIKQALKL